MLKISILIPIFNGLNYTKDCLKNIEKIFKDKSLKNTSYETVIIDDGSTDGSADWIKANYPEAHVLQGDGNLWWSGGINVGAKYSLETLYADYILLWNNDIIVRSDYALNIDKILPGLDNNVIIGSKILYDDGSNTVWSMGGLFNPKYGHKAMIGYKEKDCKKYQQIISADWLTGMGTIIPIKAITEVGYWDDVNFPQYFGDTDYTYRAKLKGFELKVYPDLIIFNSTINSGLMANKGYRSLRKLLFDVKSKSNLKINLKFYRLYGKSIFAYNHLIKSYFFLFGGYLKWKFLNMIGIKVK